MRKQRGDISMVLMLAVLVASMVAVWLLKNEAVRQMREIQEQNFQQLVEKSAAQKAVLFQNLLNWMQTRGESLLYPGCPLYQNCDVDVRKFILPAQAVDLRQYGGMASGFARHYGDPANPRFFSLLGRPYKAAVIKKQVPGRPGVYHYEIMLWEH